jgi:hypothetical protein
VLSACPCTNTTQSPVLPPALAYKEGHVYLLSATSPDPFSPGKTATVSSSFFRYYAIVGGLILAFFVPSGRSRSTGHLQSNSTSHRRWPSLTRVSLHRRQDPTSVSFVTGAVPSSPTGCSAPLMLCPSCRTYLGAPPTTSSSVARRNALRRW